MALLEYSGKDPARECYGRVQPEGSEPVLASHCENNKVGRIVGDKTVYVVQASPRFSREHAEAPPESYLPKLARAHENMWRIPTGQCTASFGHRWLYARPIWTITVDAASICRMALFTCGDSRTDSTVEEVWLDGRKAAREVLSYLSESPA